MTFVQVMLWDDANADAMPATAAAASALPHMLPSASNVATAAADTGAWTSYDAMAPGTPPEVIHAHIHVASADNCYHLITRRLCLLSW